MKRFGSPGRWLLPALVALGCSSDDDAHESMGAGSETSGAATSSYATEGSDDSENTGAVEERVPGWVWAFEHGQPGQSVPTQGDAIEDSTGHGLHARAEAGLRFVAGPRPGDVAVAFDGSGHALFIEGDRVARAADLEAAEDFRLEVTFKTDVHGREGEAGRGTLIERGAEGEPGFRLVIVDGQLRLTVRSAGDTGTLTLPALVADGRWHRVVAIRDASAQRLRLMLDGIHVADAVDPTAGQPIAGHADLRVGSGSGSGALLGAVDEVRFSRVETPVFEAEAVERTISPVFVAGQEPIVGGGGQRYHTVRIPAIVRALDGTLLAFAEGRVNDPCDHGNIDIVVKRSADRGSTWSPLERIVDAGTNRVGNPIPIVDRRTGRIVLLTMTEVLDPATCGSNATGCSCGPAGEPIRIEVRTSDDHGHSWSDPHDVTDQVTGDGWQSMLLGPSHGLQLEYGPHAGDLVVAAMHRRMGDGKRGGHLLRSSDGGQSWSIAAIENDSPVNVNESTVAELADGSLLINTRHQLAAPAVDQAEREAGLRGDAWLTPTFEWVDRPAYTRINRFRGPVVHGSLLRWPGTNRLGDGPRILFVYPAGEHGTNAGQRHDLRVWVSHDEGQSWAPGRRVLGGWAAYADVVAIDDGTIGVLAETTDAAERFYGRIDLIRLGVQTLDDPTLSWSFEDGSAEGMVAAVGSAGGFASDLIARGAVTRVVGRHASTALHFSGDGGACTTADGDVFDIGPRDGFELEAVFRTTAHGSGGPNGSGVLVSRSSVGTQPAWWLRVEDGHARFLLAGCAAANVNCGVVPGQCAGLSTCELAAATSEVRVDDGQWHHVRAGRDAAAGVVYVEVDGHRVESAWSSLAIVKNEEPVCLGAFADGTRAFVGDLDFAAFRIMD